PHEESAMLKTWTGPYGGVPPFASVEVSAFERAPEAAMDEQRREIAQIATSSAPPTFANTLAAMEGTGRTFDRVETLYGVWSSSMSSPEFQAVERTMAPKLAAFEDEITQNRPLFARIEAVYEGRAKESLTPEQERLAWRVYTRFV